MTVTQQQLDDIATAIKTAVADITSEIETLKAANPNLDVTGVLSALDSLKALDAANAPAPPTT